MSSTLEIGKTVPLQWTVTVNGTLTAATVALTITLPDQSIITPTVTTPSTGLYAASFVATQNGVHTWRWTATGAVPQQADTGQFVVGGIVSLTEAKAQLNITNSANDTELQAYIDSITASIETACGPMIAKQVTEIVEAFDLTINLLQPPVVSVTSITSIYTSGVQWLAGVLFVDNNQGVVRRNDRGGFYGGPFTAIYTAGRASVPSGVNLAARIILDWLWATQRGSMRPSNGAAPPIDVVDFPGFSYPIPARAAFLLGPYMSNAGFA